MRRNLIGMIILLVACTGEDVKPKLLLADDWEVMQVYYDGVEQIERKGLDFSFAQTADSAGIYDFPATPYDTVWPASGTWRINGTKRSITFDERIAAVYEVSPDA